MYMYCGIAVSEQGKVLVVLTITIYMYNNECGSIILDMVTELERKSLHTMNKSRVSGSSCEHAK